MSMTNVTGPDFNFSLRFANTNINTRQDIFESKTLKLVSRDVFFYHW